MRITRSFVPNLFTLMNLFMGFSSIVYTSKGMFVEASVLILFAAIFDMLDGVVARLIKSASEFGAELDSLCDVVSFGVAPSYMLYQLYFYQHGDIGILFAALPALAGALRLARFNIQLVSLEDKLYFSGLPIPSAALYIISYAIFFHDSEYFPDDYKPVLLFVVTISAAAAMVSTVKFDNIPRPTPKAIKNNPVKFTVFVIGVLVVVFTKGEMLFPLLLLYIIFSTIRHLIKLLRRKKEAEDEIDETEDNEPNFLDL